MTPFRNHRGLVVLAAVIGLLTTVVAVNSTRWIGTTFPGFFLMANRVVPSIALPDWPGAHEIFQSQVVTLDDVPVTSAEEVYERVAASPAGTPHRYEVRSPTGALSSIEIASRRISGFDYALLFGAYLSTGIAFILTGLIVVWLKRSPASAALLVQCLTTGLFVVTAADLYGPHWFFRLHVVAESLLAPGFIYVALVFPTDRIARRRGLVLSAVYLPFVLLAAAYELALTSPSAYTTAHLVASASHGVGMVAIVGAVAWDLARTRSPLVRRRIGVVSLGTLGAFALPGTLMAASAVLGGRIPINAGAFTAFLFPLSLGYAIVTQDLLEIDVMLRRAVTYGVALFAIVATSLAALSLVGALVPLQSLSPVELALINLVILFLMAPIKARAQDAVERIFYRRAYDAERELSELSQALSSAHTFAELEHHTQRLITRTLQPLASEILVTDDGTTFRRDGTSERVADAFTLPAPIADRLAGGAIVAPGLGDDAETGSPQTFWRGLAAEIVVPIRSGRMLIGALTLGRKGSGRAYNEDDVRFLTAAASQIGLAIINARAFGALADLNVRLEDQVRERTADLEVANRDLERSNETLLSAFQQLEQSQTSLMRADRMATLGRLTAGIAHEVNTPLGAVLNALQIVGDLGQEYQDSIGDPSVTIEDHYEIAREITATCKSAAGWARKAAAFIMRVKSHGREPNPALKQRFTVHSVVDETRALLAQRLRLECCELTFEEEPRGVAIVGDPARLGQVLVNLVTNALDAYEEKHIDSSRIAVSVKGASGGVEISVRDWAGGMPAEVAQRIFDELFTTKDPGRGTGLGLCISRNLIEESFGGTLTVETEIGSGSRFVITVPPVQVEAEAPLSQSA